MQSKSDFRNSLWNLSQRERAQVLLAATRIAASREHKSPTDFGRAVDHVTDTRRVIP